MLVLLAGIFVVHIATVIMLFVSTIANVSRDHPGGDTWGLLSPSAAVAHHTAGRGTGWWVLRSVDEGHLLASKGAMQGVQGMRAELGWYGEAVVWGGSLSYPVLHPRTGST